MTFAENSNPFLHDTPTYDDAPPYQVWLQMAEQFTYLLDKGRTHRKTDGHSVSTIVGAGWRWDKNIIIV